MELILIFGGTAFSPEKSSISKIPCFPGFTPEKILVQAGAVTNGYTESNSDFLPFSMASLKFGSSQLFPTCSR